MSEKPEDQLASRDAPRPRSFVRDVLVGGGVGLGLACLDFLFLGNGDGSALGLRAIPYALGLGVLMFCGGAAGHVLGGPVGAACGVIVAYVVPFVVYGMRVQCTTGWANKLRRDPEN